MSLKDLSEKLHALQGTVYFDEKRFFREQTNDRGFVQKLIAELEEKRKAGGEETYFLLGVLGNCYRILNMPQQAIEVFQETLRYHGGEEKKRMITLIRLGEAYKYNEQHQMALQVFKQAVDIIFRNQFSDYLDFLYQHQGKCYFELNELGKARELLAEAFAIRMGKGDPSLIASTKQVLEEVERRLGE